MGGVDFGRGKNGFTFGRSSYWASPSGWNAESLAPEALSNPRYRRAQREGDGRGRTLSRNDTTPRGCFASFGRRENNRRAFLSLCDSFFVGRSTSAGVLLPPSFTPRPRMQRGTHVLFLGPSQNWTHRLRLLGEGPLRQPVAFFARNLCRSPETPEEEKSAAERTDGGGHLLLSPYP